MSRTTGSETLSEKPRRFSQISTSLRRSAKADVRCYLAAPGRLEPRCAKLALGAYGQVDPLVAGFGNPV
jgi:hypothetical protein